MSFCLQRRILQQARCTQKSTSAFFPTFEFNRNFGNSSGQFRTPRITENNPFDILGIPKSSTYQQVKSRFVELALTHHPDISKDGDSENFVRFREAFEQIRQTESGGARLTRRGEADTWSDHEFEAWFYEETGHSDILFRMDLATRKEVIDIANTQSQGGLDKGGAWEMARAMAEQQKTLHEKRRDSHGSIGIERGESTPPSSRRRRRKK